MHVSHIIGGHGRSTRGGRRRRTSSSSSLSHHLSIHLPRCFRYLPQTRRDRLVLPPLLRCTHTYGWAPCGEPASSITTTAARGQISHKPAWSQFHYKIKSTTAGVRRVRHHLGLIYYSHYTVNTLPNICAMTIAPLVGRHPNHSPPNCTLLAGWASYNKTRPWLL